MMATNQQDRLASMRHVSCSPPSPPSNQLAPRPRPHPSQDYSHQHEPSYSLYHTPHNSQEGQHASRSDHHLSEPDLSLSDEDMLLCSDDDDDEDGDNWSRAGSEGKHRQGSTGSAGTGGRSRRLLSVQQSKVLYKILEKVSTPPPLLRNYHPTEAGFGGVHFPPPRVEWGQMTLHITPPIPRVTGVQTHTNPLTLSSPRDGLHRLTSRQLSYASKWQRNSTSRRVKCKSGFKTVARSARNE